MKLTKTTENLKSYKATKIDGIIDEFMAMNCDKVKIESWEEDYASVSSVTNVINAALRRRRLNGYRAVQRNGVPYIAKTSEL